MKSIYINGVERRNVEADTLTALLAAEKIAPAGVIVERNGEIVDPAVDWSALPLADGDRINLFRVVAGG